MASTDIRLDTTLPASLTAEKSILGAILLDNLSYYEASEHLGSDDFSLDAHRRIYARINDLIESNRPVDIITVAEELRNQHQLEAVGGVAYLASLTEGLPKRANIQSYVKIVKDKAILRGLIHISNQAMVRAFEQSESVEDIVGSTEGDLLSLAEQTLRSGFKTVPEIVKESFGSVDELLNPGQHINGLETHYVKFDSMTRGLQPGDLIIIAGRPSMGKTAFAVNIAENAAVIGKKVVGIFSLEMSRESLLRRLLCSQARVDSHRMTSGFISREDSMRLAQALGALSEAPIFLDDTPAIGLSEMRAKARRLQRQQGRLDLLVVDYLQLLSSSPTTGKRYENRTQEVSAISRGLKALAKELKVPVVALSQLSRAPESRGGDHRPQLSDLRESGSIEQDADVVAFLFREEYYDRDNPDLEGLAELIIAKQRNGPTGTVKLAFAKGSTRFDNLAEDSPY